MSLGIFDRVKFSEQTVEFVIVLSAKTSDDVVWLKDGTRVAPNDEPTSRWSSAGKSKYVSSVDNTGLIHKLVVSDVQIKDEGIYTFKVQRVNEDDDGPQTSTRFTIQGAQNEANVSVLMKGLAERQTSAQVRPGMSRDTGTNDHK